MPAWICRSVNVTLVLLPLTVDLGDNVAVEEPPSVVTSRSGVELPPWLPEEPPELPPDEPPPVDPPPEEPPVSSS